MATDTTPVAVIGAAGRMGRVICAAVREQPDLELVGEIELGDDLAATLRQSAPRVAVDFSLPASVFENTRTCLEQGVHPVVGATGLGEPQLTQLSELARTRGIGGLVAPNFSIGAVLLMRFASEAASHFGSAEIIEYHHPGKLDAPSGTALRTRELLGSRPADGAEIPIHSVRLGGFLAHQEVIFGGLGERLTLRHDSIDRECFAPGVLQGVRAVVGSRELVVGLEHIL